MAGTATPIFPQTIKNYPAQIVTADGTNKVSLVAGAANGTKLEALTISSTDTAARDVLLWLTIGGVDYLLTTISIPANSGNTNALPAVDVLRSTQIPGLSYDSSGNRILYVASGTTLKMSAGAAVTAAKALAALAVGGDF